MNVIISNKNQLLLENLGIDVIKEMNGEFEVDEIIATFQNFFYQRMILDITAIKNYTDIVNLQKLSISLPTAYCINFVLSLLYKSPSNEQYVALLLSTINFDRLSHP